MRRRNPHDYRDMELRKCDATRPVSKPLSLKRVDTRANAEPSSSVSPPTPVPAQLQVCSETCSNVAYTSGIFTDFDRTTVRRKDTVEVVQEILRYTWKKWDKRARRNG